MYKLRTSISFETAHRLYDVATYSEECRNNLHGHSYVLTLIVQRNELNDASMVMDFKLLKKILRENIEDVYDHSVVVKKDDPLAESLIKNCKKVHVVDANPTAEWMAETFAVVIQNKIDDVDKFVRVASVEIQETEKNIAIYEVPEYENF